MKNFPKIINEFFWILGVGLLIAGVAFVFGIQRNNPQSQGYPSLTPTLTPDLILKDAYPVGVSAPTPDLPIIDPTPAYVLYLPPNGERIVYLASDPKNIASDLPTQAAELEGKGITLLYDFAEFQERFENQDTVPEAIIIHESRIEAVDKEWLQKIYPKGVVMCGVNMSRQKLGELVGDELAAKDPNVSAISKIYWSCLYYKEDPNFTEEHKQELLELGFLAGSWGGDSGHIHDAVGLDTFLSVIRKMIAGLK